jgi:hypothetical protein
MITPCSKLTRSSRISYLFIKHDYTLSQTDNKQLYNIILICQSWLHPVPDWQQEALEYRINLSSMITPCPKLTTRSSSISYEFVQAWLHPVPNWQEPLVYRMNLSSMITPCPKPTTRTSSISCWFVKQDYTLSQTDNKKL